MRRSAHGFTLVEVLLATALLAAGLTLAFATITGATRAAQRGEEFAQVNEHIRAVEGFLRRRLAGARAVPFQVDSATGLPMRFSGERDRMRFVSDLPDYIGRGGPQLHELRIDRATSGDGVRLTLALSVVESGAMDTPTPRAPELLADDLSAVHFRYRGLGENGKLADWRDHWTAVEQLPVLVEIDIVGADGRHWPRLAVAPRLAAGYSGGGTP